MFRTAATLAKLGTKLEGTCPAYSFLSHHEAAEHIPTDPRAIERALKRRVYIDDDVTPVERVDDLRWCADDLVALEHELESGTIHSPSASNSHI
jgi:hypothetical protein